MPRLASPRSPRPTRRRWPRSSPASCRPACTARFGAEYEWGVHFAFFAAKAGLAEAERAATAHAGPEAWTGAEAVLVRMVDALVDTAPPEKEHLTNWNEHSTSAAVGKRDGAPRCAGGRRRGIRRLLSCPKRQRCG